MVRTCKKADVTKRAALPRNLPNGMDENQGKLGTVGAPFEIITDYLPSKSYKCYRLGQIARSCSAMEIMKGSQKKFGHAGNVAGVDVKRIKQEILAE